MELKNIGIKWALTGRVYKTCMVSRCRNKSFGEQAGIIFCRQHLKRDLINDYGSIKTAAKYCNVYNLKD